MQKQFFSGILLASGFGRRFGSDKLLISWQGNTLLYHSIRQAVFSDLHEIIIVVQEKHRALCQEYKCSFLEQHAKRMKIIVNPLANEGMAASIRMGVRHCHKKSTAALFLLADQPFFKTEDINLLCSSYRKRDSFILAPFLDGVRKNPVLMSLKRYKDELLRLSGDRGARKLLLKYQDIIHQQIFYDKLKFIDIDTQDKYAFYHKQTFTFSSLLSSSPFISIIGAGGKTSLMWNIYHESWKNQQACIFSTTTKIWNKLPVGLDLRIISQANLQPQEDIHNKMLFLASEISSETSSDKKLIGLAPEILDFFIVQNNNLKMLVEADGAHEKIFKVHADHEPCIPSKTDLIILVLNIAIIGKTLSKQHIHRFQLLPQKFHKKCTAKTLFDILTASYGYFAQINSFSHKTHLEDKTPFLFFINGVEKKQDYLKAKKLISLCKKNKSTSSFKQCHGILLGSNKQTYYEFIAL